MVGVLFHQKDGHPGGRQFPQGGEDLFHHDRRQTQARLIEQQQLRSAHQCPGDGEHLLLATGHGHGPLVASLLEPWEQFEHALHVLAGVLVTNGDSAHQQVFLDRHVGEYPPPFRRLRNAVGRDVVRRLVGDVHALVNDLPTGRARLAEDRHQQRGFAGTVGADQAHCLTFVNVHRDFLQGLDRPIEYVQFLEFEDRSTHTSSSSSAPR